MLLHTVSSLWSGADVVRAMTDLRARHAATGWRVKDMSKTLDLLSRQIAHTLPGNAHIGIDGKTGKVADVKVRRRESCD